jgi:hypothetical protein
MELKLKWSDAGFIGEDIDKLFKFVEDLPDNIEQFIDSEISNLKDKTEKLKSPDLSFDNIHEAFFHAKNIIKDELTQLNHTNHKNQRIKAMQQAGLDGKSLTLKLGLLNELWTKVLEYIHKRPRNIIDFFDNELATLIKKFLNYLNALLDSIKSVYPSIEAMIEFKDILVAFFDLVVD